ncbi:glycoside hydrolase family 2 [Halosolutus amylolyticus]|uniref:Glycoside hydrolase family 2 n=1 Tax=Halosolutus amylolyticus TaxID=2932267 RepID=A0ABD5PUM6_9EURY|nr:glycoside hydrolase family 2 [Halosolutus amylolyticus]
MTDGWTGGVVESIGADGSPTVDEWQPVTVPGRSGAFAADRDDGTIAYRATVPDPRERDIERALLELRGTYGRTRVWMNGTELGEHEPHFVPARFEFEPDAENELLVVCEPPSSFDGIYGTDEVPAETAMPGIWWDVTVESRPRTFCRRLDATPRLDGDGAAIEVDLEIDAGAALDDAVTFSVRPEGFRGGASMERTPVTAAAGERVTVSKTIEVRDPSLWWPRGHGPQRRYTVRAKLGGDAVEETVGFCHVERDDDGLVVNGTRVPARGFTRLPGGDPETDVERAVEANATIVRPRAHVPPREFYRAADEAGLLVWQDLPAIGPDLDVDRGTTLATTLAGEYGHHPSLAMYGVQDRPTDPFADPLGTGFLAKLRLRYRVWQTAVDHDAARTIADDFPDDRPVVPVTGAPGTDPDAAHLAPGWQYLAPADVDWLLDRYPSFGSIVTGFGAGSLTADVDPETVPGLDRAAPARRPNDVEDSQRYQTRTLKTVTEALRRRGCGVLTAATLRDPTPGGGMGVLAQDGEPKAAYEAIALSFEPVQAVLDGPPEPGSVGITLCNDTTDDLEPTVGWRAGTETGETSVSVGPLETASAGTARIPADADRIDLEVSTADRTVRNRYSL